MFGAFLTPFAKRGVGISDEFIYIVGPLKSPSWAREFSQLNGHFTIFYLLVFMSKVYDWFEERLEIQAIADDIQSKYVPPHVNIFYCLGGITFTLSLFK